jgi:hypothetical protein
MGFMKHADGMGSDTITCMQSFIKIGSGIQKLIGGGGNLWTQRLH